MSLGLNDDPPLGAFTPEPRHKSAGLAFGLSLLLPGLGQFYCGKTARGGMTLGFWFAALVACFAHVPPAWLGQALFLMLVLWIFSFLDSYFTAIEINQGQDDLVDGQNPRVAVTLNLLTAGFGYFYLGEQTKGITLFVVMQVARLALPSTGRLGVFISLGLFALQLWAAENAYRIARRKVTSERSDWAATGAQPIENAAPASRLPVQVPVVLACLLPAGFVILVVIGLVFRSMRSGKHAPAVVSLKHQAVQGTSNRSQRHNDTPVPVVDFATAVQDVQRIERKSVRGEDIPNLKLDVRMLTSVLGQRKINNADAMVAHYYRALALSMTNTAHEHNGEAMDISGARTALADFDKVIRSGTGFTYVPEVSITNAEYSAGSVAHDQLHDDKAAYSYWNKCASNGHAGCVNILAGARVTGVGGEKVDVQEALRLHTGVYNTGTKFYCAGAYSAMTIAEINYFTLVRRPGDDELEWIKKADGLLDQLEASQNNRNVCDRSDIEVEEFLFELSKGHRNDNILQDALSRMDEDSVSTKALIQFISGAIDEKAFDAVVNSIRSEDERCSAYFEAMWYSELRAEDAMARRFHQHMLDIGRAHCAENLVYAGKFKF